MFDSPEIALVLFVPLERSKILMTVELMRDLVDSITRSIPEQYILNVSSNEKRGIILSGIHICNQQDTKRNRNFDYFTSVDKHLFKKFIED